MIMLATYIVRGRRPPRHSLLCRILFSLYGLAYFGASTCGCRFSMKASMKRMMGGAEVCICHDACAINTAVSSSAPTRGISAVHVYMLYDVACECIVGIEDTFPSIPFETYLGFVDGIWRIRPSTYFLCCTVGGVFVLDVV